MAHTTAIGTPFLIGAVFLSLNALAVSARPGGVSPAEKTIAITQVAPGPAKITPVPIPPYRVDPVRKCL